MATMFIILIMIICFIVWYVQYIKYKKDKYERMKRFNMEQKIYADEYTQGKYDFETYKYNISWLHEKYQV